jgi:hypothetical protein
VLPDGITYLQESSVVVDGWSRIRQRSLGPLTSRPTVGLGAV